MPMQWRRLPEVFPGQPMWGATAGAFTFVVTRDAPDRYTASVEVAAGPRHELGGYLLLAAAQAACTDFLTRQSH